MAASKAFQSRYCIASMDILISLIASPMSAWSKLSITRWDDPVSAEIKQRTKGGVGAVVLAVLFAGLALIIDPTTPTEASVVGAAQAARQLAEWVATGLYVAATLAFAVVGWQAFRCWRLEKGAEPGNW